MVSESANPPTTHTRKIPPLFRDEDHPGRACSYLLLLSNIPTWTSQPPLNLSVTSKAADGTQYSRLQKLVVYTSRKLNLEDAITKFEGLELRWDETPGRFYIPPYRLESTAEMAVMDAADLSSSGDLSEKDANVAAKVKEDREDTK
ncbi:hypothetical protein M422DRAFT_267822 [Sphaerobolus stellatus SS14]|uniref:Uncharacterized protein n=1 Tax=Sphaerobolus stellatus (strain SS14) TaxID=990650 RepID=A0A0C9UZL2_SPHS4|nr:hypothetical protein M422DRAFT_267822 [Sphaerobolus stellatus SS14]